MGVTTAEQLSELVAKLKVAADELSRFDGSEKASAALASAAVGIERSLESGDLDTTEQLVPAARATILKPELWHSMLDYPFVRIALSGVRAVPADVRPEEGDELYHTYDALIYFNELVKEIGATLP